MNVERMNGRPATGGDEVDAFGKNHRVHGYRPGQRNRIKQIHNSRVRRAVRRQLRTGRFE
jgi:hypothetical protein